jgi:hypothetical protein
VNSGYAATVLGLSEAQQKLISEAAEAFARQFASRPELLNVNNQSVATRSVEQPAAPIVRHPGFARGSPVRQNVAAQPQRAEAVLMAVAGVRSKDQVYDHEGMTDAEFVAANKRKGPSYFRCRQNGNFLNDCEAILCDCCQKPDISGMCSRWRKMSSRSTSQVRMS